MADGIVKNLQVVWRQIESSAFVWRTDITDTWDRLGEAVDDKDWLEVGHLLLAAAGDTLRFFLRLDRLWLYVFLAWLVSLTGAFNWPLSWTGF